jgi:integrase/recombinase XerC
MSATLPDAPALPSSARTYLDQLTQQRRVSPHTAAAYRRDLTRLAGLAASLTGAGGQGGVALECLQVHHLRRFVAQLHGQGLSGRSLGRVLSGWRGYFGWLGRNGLIAHDPCAGLRPPKSPRHLPATLSPDEAARLLDADLPPATEAPDADELAQRDTAIFELFYSSGLRLAELAALNLDSLVDLRQGEVRVTGKRNKTRLVPVGEKARQAIEAWLVFRGAFAAAGEAALFVSRRGGRLSMRTIQSRLAQRAQAAGMPRRVHPHLLRHSFASHVLQSSGDLRAVQEMLGHASIASTQIYTHLDFQHLAKVYDAAHPRAKKK